MAQPVKVVKARLKFHSSIPWFLELVLRDKYGYEFLSRKNGPDGWVVYQKMSGPFSPKGVDYHDLSESVVNDLTRRVNHIANSFKDPDAHRDTIKARCTNLARTLEPKQRAWVMAWIERTIDNDFDDQDELPWADGVDSH